MRYVVLFLLTMACISCATASTPFRVREQQTVSVEVRNLNFYDATVYAITNLGEQRLGIVGGITDRTLEARMPASGSMQLRVKLLAGGEYWGDKLMVFPGDTVVLIIPSRIWRLS